MKSASNGDVELLRLRALCFLEMGDLENALKHLQQAVRSDPDNSDLRTVFKSVRNLDEQKSGGDAQFKATKNYSDDSAALNDGLET